MAISKRFASENYVNENLEIAKTEINEEITSLYGEIVDLENEKVGKTAITLDKHTDGLIYIFVDGVRVGNGVELGTIVAGDVIGAIDENNNILLSGALPDGTYTFKYETEEGEFVEVGTLEVGAIEMPTISGNLADPTSDDWLTDTRLATGYGTGKDATGCILTNYIPAKMGDTLGVEGLAINSFMTDNNNHCTIGYYKADKTYQHFVATSAGISVSAEGAKEQISVSGNVYTYTIALLGDGTQKATSETGYIRISAALADGYTAEDVIITINEEIDEAVEQYTVTNTLTNCSNSNSVTQVAEGSSYSATITANSGYSLSSVTVTMGGTDITSTVVSGGTISIASVTGNVVITAVATEDVVTPSDTNLLKSAIDADGSPYNGGKGYKSGYKISTTGGGESATTGAYVSGFMPVTDIYDCIRVKNVTLSAQANVNNFVFYDSSKTKITATSTANGTAGAFHQSVMNEGNGVYACKPEFFMTVAQASDIAFFRFSCGGITDDTIVTVNEEIV